MKRTQATEYHAIARPQPKLFAWTGYLSENNCHEKVLMRSERVFSGPVRRTSGLCANV